MGLPTHCSSAILAKLLGLSERRIHQLAHSGIIPKVKFGQYESVGGIRGYINYLYPHHACQSLSSEQQQKARLIGLQADLLALRLAREQEALMSAETVAQIWANTILRARVLWSGSPPKLDPPINPSVDELDTLSRMMRQCIKKAFANFTKPYKEEKIR